MESVLGSGLPGPVDSRGLPHKVTPPQMARSCSTRLDSPEKGVLFSLDCASMDTKDLIVHFKGDILQTLKQSYKKVDFIFILH